MCVDCFYGVDLPLRVELLALGLAFGCDGWIARASNEDAQFFPCSLDSIKRFVLASNSGFQLWFCNLSCLHYCHESRYMQSRRRRRTHLIDKQN